MCKTLPLLVLLLSVGVFAQTTTYTQSSAQHCALATFNCNQIPLGSEGSYNFLFGNMTFTLNVPSSPACCVLGTITKITQAPKLVIGWSGLFAFDWEVPTSDGTIYTGAVTGTIYVTRLCSRYCWPYAIVESSTVTVN